VPGAKFLFLVAGAKKARILQDVLENPEAAKKYPSAMVTGNVTWLIDQAAAQIPQNLIKDSIMATSESIKLLIADC